MNEIPLSMVISVVVVALTVGTVMIGAVVRTYWVHKWFDKAGGTVLTFGGVALIGLSVYGNVTLKVGDFEAEFKVLQSRIDALQSDLQLASNFIDHRDRELEQVSEELMIVSKTLNSASAYVTDSEDLAKIKGAIGQLETMSDEFSWHSGEALKWGTLKEAP